MEEFLKKLLEAQSSALSAIPTRVKPYGPVPDMTPYPSSVIQEPKGLQINGPDIGSIFYRGSLADRPIGDLLDYAFRMKARRAIGRENLADIEARSKQLSLEKERALLPFTMTSAYHETRGKGAEAFMKERTAPLALSKAGFETAALPLTTLTDIMGKTSLSSLHEAQRKVYEDMFRDNPVLSQMYSEFLDLFSRYLNPETGQ